MAVRFQGGKAVPANNTVLDKATVRELQNARNALDIARDVQRMVVSALSQAGMTSTLAQFQRAMGQLQEVSGEMYRKIEANK